MGLIENMAGYACPHCGEISDPFGSGGGSRGRRNEHPFLGRIPLRMSIREASDAGRPPAPGEGEEADIFRALAVALLEQLVEEPLPVIPQRDPFGRKRPMKGAVTRGDE